MWRDLVHCNPGNAHLFHSEDLIDRAAAIAICKGCPVRVQCLNHAVTEVETEGIWGGTDIELRRWLRSKYRAGRETYTAALLEVLADERPWQEARDCERCGAPVPAGFHPIDRNGPRASCGLASTFNKGCRCRACGNAKTDYDRDRKTAAKHAGKIGSSSPKR